MASEGASKRGAGAKPEEVPEGEVDRDSVRKQVEYFFSRKNLQQDTFLVGHMDSEMWVDVELIAQFKSLQALVRADPVLLADIMRESKAVTVSADGKRMKPNIKIERKTLILRDIPSSTPAEEIREIFSYLDEDSRPTSVTSEVKDNWYVHFESEEKCVKAHLSLLGKKFQGKPIGARVKSETLLKSIFQPTSPAPGFAMFPVAEVGGYVYNGVVPAGAIPAGVGGVRGRGRGQGDFRGPGNPSKRKGKRQPGSNKKQPHSSTPQQVPLGLTHFPPLPTKDAESGPSGYGSETFIRIDTSDMFKLRKAVAQTKKPEFLTECLVVSDQHRNPVVQDSPLTTEESAEIFEHCDEARHNQMSCSPFVSPFFASVATVPELPAEEMLTPPHTVWQPHRTRAVVEKTLSRAAQPVVPKRSIVSAAIPDTAASAAPTVTPPNAAQQHDATSKPAQSKPSKPSKPAASSPQQAEEKTAAPENTEKAAPSPSSQNKPPPGNSFLAALLSPKKPQAAPSSSSAGSTASTESAKKPQQAEKPQQTPNTSAPSNENNNKGRVESSS